MKKHNDKFREALQQNKIATDEDLSFIVSYFKAKYNSLQENFREAKNEAISISEHIKELKVRLEACEKDYRANKNIFSPNKNMDVYIEQEIEKLKVKIDKEKIREKNIFEQRNGIEKAISEISEVIISIDRIESRFNDYHHIVNSIMSSKQVNNLDDIYDDKLSKTIVLLDMQEKERQRIAREMHDGPVQNLTNIIHKSELCNKIIDRDAIRTKLEIQGIINSSRGIINEMRGIIYNLRPMSIDDLGLIPTVEKMIIKIKQEHEIKIIFHIENEEYKLKNIVNLTLFRVIEEAVNNCVKYSKAEEIYLYIKYANDNIEIIIRDEGIGFDVNNANESKDNKNHLGLSIMKERIFILSGEFEIKSELNKGTEYYINVPTINFKEM